VECGALTSLSKTQSLLELAGGFRTPKLFRSYLGAPVTTTKMASLVVVFVVELICLASKTGCGGVVCMALEYRVGSTGQLGAMWGRLEFTLA